VPPCSYLISFILLVVIMSTLLMCHCYRMMRIAQRMRAGELPTAAPGSAGQPGAKRGTPDHIVAALPVLRFGDTEQRRELLEQAKQERAVRLAEAQTQRLDKSSSLSGRLAAAVRGAGSRAGWSVDGVTRPGEAAAAAPAAGGAGAGLGADDVRPSADDQCHTALSMPGGARSLRAGGREGGRMGEGLCSGRPLLPFLMPATGDTASRLPARCGCAPPPPHACPSWFPWCAGPTADAEAAIDADGPETCAIW
jgi:hypothetical protein